MCPSKPIMITEGKPERRHRRPRTVRPMLEPDDLKRIKALLNKFPEMNTSTMVRRAIRELAEKEQVA